jgi:predicted nucleic-acid-binding Zn-ribbon protein
MPYIEVVCENCKFYEEFFKVDYSPIDPELGHKTTNLQLVLPRCPKCETDQLKRMYTGFPGVVFKGLLAGKSATKKKRQMDKDEEYASVGIQSNMELQTIRGMAKEEEKDKGMKPGTILGGIPAPTTKEEKLKVKEVASKKAKEAREIRKGLV